MHRVRAMVFVLGGLLIGGCFSASNREPRFIEDIRPVPPVVKVMSFAIQRRDLQEALTHTNENTIRLVPVYQNVSVRQSYEYRVFDVKDASAYALLGIQSSDIIVAVDRYLLKRPEQFPAFVQLVAGMNEASIEVRRGGEARLFKYRFIPAIAAE